MGCSNLLARDPPNSFDNQAQSKEAERPRKGLRLTRWVEEMDPDPARGFASRPGDASSGRAVRESAGDAADVHRSDGLEWAKGSVTLPLDRFAADSGDVPGAPLDFGRSAILPARGL